MERIFSIILRATTTKKEGVIREVTNQERELIRVIAAGREAIDDSMHKAI